MNKKITFAMTMATMLASSTMACEYQTSTGTYNITNTVVNNYGMMNYYSNSSSGTQVNSTSTYVADVCGYCGLTWDLCTCYDGNYQEECYGNDSGCATDYSTGCDDNWSDNNVCVVDNYCYQGYSGDVMAHWGNLRDACGNVITQVGEGSRVEVIGQCEDNPSRTLIYDYTSGCYGTVASVYLYGGTCYEYENPTEWGGTSCSYAWDRDTTSYEGNSCTHYDETTPWAADTCPEYETGYATNPEEYCSDDYYIDLDMDADTINVVNNGVIILSGVCTCEAKVYCGQEFRFADQKCYGIWNNCSDGFYSEACQYMNADSMVCCR